MSQLPAPYRRFAGLVRNSRELVAVSFAFTGIECVGVLAIAGLWLFRNEQPPRWFLMMLLAGSLLTVIAMIETADRGRQIRHPEITRLSQ
jgi:hypothetical protein